MNRQSISLNLFFIFFYVIEVHPSVLDHDHDVNSDHWVVQTNSGPVEGTVTTGFTGEDVHVFYGIPYADPPVNDLRFKPPKPVTPWTDILQATKKPLACYQQHTQGDTEEMRNAMYHAIPRPWSEDCLKLNIWTPKPQSQDQPVLVFFHAGSFRTGSGTYPFMDGSTLSAQAKDVIITMNFRLGAFGFLYMGVPDAPGNMGLLDQQLALKWIQDNAHHFGGKKEAVILVGGGAGGASAGYHMLSPGSAGLFKTVAVISGAPTCFWAFHDQELALNKARTLLSRLRCDKGTTEERVQCLRNVHPEDIVDADRSGSAVSEEQFKPTVDGTFITETPTEALKAGRYNKVVILAFSNSHEGSFLLTALNPDNLPNPGEGFCIEGFRKAVRRIYPYLTDAGMNAVEDYYLDKCSREDYGKMRDAAIKVYGDVVIECCLNRFVEYAVGSGSHVFRIVDDLRQSSLPDWVGSYHMATPIYILGYPQAQERYGFSKAEANMSSYFIQWINEHTRRSAHEVNDYLSVFTLEEKKYVYWDAVGPNYWSHYREEECHLWNNVLPQLAKGKRKCDTN